MNDADPLIIHQSSFRNANVRCITSESRLVESGDKPRVAAEGFEAGIPIEAAEYESFRIHLSCGSRDGRVATAEGEVWSDENSGRRRAPSFQFLEISHDQPCLLFLARHGESISELRAK